MNKSNILKTTVALLFLIGAISFDSLKADDEGPKDGIYSTVFSFLAAIPTVLCFLTLLAKKAGLAYSV